MWIYCRWLFFCGEKVAKNRKNSPNPLTKKGKMGRIKPIRKFFRERRGMVMGRRILAVLAALLALLWAAVATMVELMGFTFL